MRLVRRFTDMALLPGGTWLMAARDYVRNPERKNFDKLIELGAAKWVTGEEPAVETETLDVRDTDTGPVQPAAKPGPTVWRSPWSGTVAALGHDPATDELHVVWSNNGRRSVYAGVSAGHATEIMNAPSVGAALHSLRRAPDLHPHRYHDE